MAQTLSHNLSEGGLFQVSLLTPEHYAAHWPEISRQLDTIPHIWEPWFTKEWLQMAFYHNMQVWTAGLKGKFHIIVWTQVYHWPAKDVFQVCLMFGNQVERAIPALEAVFEKVAHNWGCEEFEIIGREGWGRKLRGARRVATVYRRSIPQFGVH